MENIVCELECNVDDMTAEELSYAQQRLLDAGARDVYVTPIEMKKSRQGMLITVMCDEPDRERMIGLIFRYTSTIGIREILSRRYILDRRETEVTTPYGTVRKKISEGFGITRSKFEYDDLAEIAGKLDISLKEAAEIAKNCDK